MIFFSEEEKNFLKSKINVNLSDVKEDDDYIALEDKVTQYLCANGFDDEYRPNSEGKLCESIMDKLAMIE